MASEMPHLSSAQEPHPGGDRWARAHLQHPQNRNTPLPTEIPGQQPQPGLQDLLSIVGDFPLGTYSFLPWRPAPPNLCVSEQTDAYGAWRNAVTSSFSPTKYHLSLPESSPLVTHFFGLNIALPFEMQLLEERVTH